jgi:hypothetical protein
MDFINTSKYSEAVLTAVLARLAAVPGPLITKKDSTLVINVGDGSGTRLSIAVSDEDRDSSRVHVSQNTYVKSTGSLYASWEFSFEFAPLAIVDLVIEFVSKYYTPPVVVPPVPPPPTP